MKHFKNKLSCFLSLFLLLCFKFKNRIRFLLKLEFEKGEYRGKVTPLMITQEELRIILGENGQEHDYKVVPSRL